MAKVTPRREPVFDRGQRIPGLYKRGNVYQQRVYPASHPNGTWQPLKSKSHRDAVAESRALKGVAQDELIAPNQMTMTQLWEAVSAKRRALDPSEDGYWSLGTYEKVYEPRWRKNIEPVIGKMRVQAVTARDVNRVYETMQSCEWTKTGKDPKRVLATGTYSRSTRLQVRRLLNVLFTEAQKVSMGPIRNSTPMTGADNPKAKKHGPTPQAQVLRWETDVDAILGALRAREGATSTPRVTERDYLIIWLIAVTGLRVSEILGLVWGDIDLVEGTIFLQQQLAYGVKSSEIESIEEARANLKWDKQEDAPKKRKLALSPETLRLLRAFRKAELERGRWQQDGLVFSTYYGKPVSPRNVHDTLAEAAVSAKVGKPAHPHALRHAYATWLYHSGTPMEKIQELLGHASIETTESYVTKIQDETTLAWQREAQARAGIR